MFNITFSFQKSLTIYYIRIFPSYIMKYDYNNPTGSGLGLLIKAEGLNGIPLVLSSKLKRRLKERIFESYIIIRQVAK